VSTAEYPRLTDGAATDVSLNPSCQQRQALTVRAGRSGDGEEGGRVRAVVGEHVGRACLALDDDSGVLDLKRESMCLAYDARTAKEAAYATHRPVNVHVERVDTRGAGRGPVRKVDDDVERVLLGAVARRSADDNRQGRGQHARRAVRGRDLGGVLRGRSRRGLVLDVDRRLHKGAGATEAGRRWIAARQPASWRATECATHRFRRRTRMGPCCCSSMQDGAVSSRSGLDGASCIP
jgi:hypothetical protein